MGRKITKKNFRVEVYPNYYRFFVKSTDQDQEDECKVILQQILRHVDNVDKNASQVTWDTEATCEFCGSAWTTVTPHNDGCCEKDLEIQDNYIAHMKRA